MAKIVQIPHHSNCNCCGKQASFNELGRRPSGFGPLKSAPMQKRPNTHHGTIQPLERRVSERRGSSSQRRKILQHGSQSTQENSAQKTCDLLLGENYNGEEIAEGVANIAQLEILLVQSRIQGTSRDKESLLEEFLALKEALYDQLYHLQLHRVHHETVIDNQRKLEIAIQELEMAHGLQAPRTGDPSQLKARILGLKCRQQEYYNMLTIQGDDIVVLKKDPRVSLTKEASTERDVFAMEARRLQKIILSLRIVYHKVCSENNEVVRLRENIAKLKVKIEDTEKRLKNYENIIEQMKKDIKQAKAESVEAQKKAKKAVWKAGELESHSLVLQNMLARAKEEGNSIQKQTSALGEQIRILKKENVERSIQEALAAQGRMDMDAKKGGKKLTSKTGKLKEYKTDDSRASSPSSTDLSAVRSSSPSSPATPSSTSTVNKEVDELRAIYLKAIGKATDTFIENAPGSGSPKSKPHPNLGSLTGNHSEYEKLQGTFEKDIKQAEDKFIEMMDKMEYGVVRRRNRSDLEAEAKRLREQLEALQKQHTDMNKWLESLTIELDDKVLKVGEYAVNVQDSKTNVKITSPDKTPEALARKEAEEEARRRKAEEEEAARQKKVAEEEEARKKREAEEAAKRKRDEDAAAAARQAAEEAAQKKRDEEDAARRAADEAAQKKRDEEDAARRAADEAAQKKRDEEDAARRAADEAAQKKRDEEDVARRAADEAAKKKRDEEDAARRAAEEAAKKKRDKEDAARRAAEEAAKKKREEEDAARRAAEEAAKKKSDEEDAARRAAEEAKGGEFFTDDMTNTIKDNIKEVLEHLETISHTVQQKASSSGGMSKSDEAPGDSK